MATKHTTVRFPEASRRQLGELARRLGLSRTAVLCVALDALSRRHRLGLPGDMPGPEGNPSFRRKE